MQRIGGQPVQARQKSKNGKATMDGSEANEWGREQGGGSLRRGLRGGEERKSE